jgi:membrane-associated protein
MEVLSLDFLLSLDVVYIVILLGVLGFTSAFFLLPPGQWVLIAGGIVCSVYNVWFLDLFLLLGVCYFAGNYLLYVVSRRYGEDLVLRYIPLPKRKLNDDLLVMKYLFRKHGAEIILIGRNLPIVNGIVSFVAGVVGVGHRKYIVYTAVGVCSWVLLWMGVGFFLGFGYQHFLDGFGLFGAIVVLILLTVSVFYVRASFSKLLIAAKKSEV